MQYIVIGCMGDSAATSSMVHQCMYYEQNRSLCCLTSHDRDDLFDWSSLNMNEKGVVCLHNCLGEQNCQFSKY